MASRRDASRLRVKFTEPSCASIQPTKSSSATSRMNTVQTVAVHVVPVTIVTHRLLRQW